MTQSPLYQEIVEEARRDQHVKTLFGRVRPIPDINSKNANQRGFAERTAVNTPLQGTAADLISTRASAVMAKLCMEFDLVLVDAPPVLAASEAQELAGVADGVLLLTKAAETGAKQVSEAMSALSRARANVVGLVLNQVKTDVADARASYHLEALNSNDSIILPRLNA